jgi:hypothetical protein
MFQSAQIRALTIAAKHLGADIPTDVAQVIAHAQTIAEQVRHFGTSEAEIIPALCEHIGNPDAPDSALPAALNTLTHSSVAASLAVKLEQQATAIAWRTRRNAEHISAAFGTAVQPALDVLNKQARLVPSWVTSATADDLSPTQFKAWKACTAAEATIEQALLALAPLYGNPADDQFTIEAMRRMVVIETPPRLSYDQAWLWVRAASGRRALGSVVGTLRVDNAGAWFASVAELGGSFQWAGIAEIKQRIDKLKAGTVKPVLGQSA